MPPIKISVIGAGSATFSLGLIRDLCLTARLADSVICFMDINERKLDNVVQLCRRYAQETNTPLTIEKTTDQRQCLHEADFVINLALVVGHDGYRRGFAIAQRHGYRYGGSHHVMHDESFFVNFFQLQQFEAIVADMRELCPQAWLLLLANPVLAGTTYLRRKYKDLKFVGLCHGYAGVYSLTDAMGLRREDVDFQVSGVNHFIWLTRFRHKGQDAYPLLDRWIAEKAPEFWKTCGTCHFVGPKPVDLYRRFGIFPIGDTSNPGGGAWPWWYHADDETEKRWQEDTRAWWKWCSDEADQWSVKLDRLLQDYSSRMTSVFPPVKTDESIIPFIESMACDIPGVFYVNIVNERGYVPGVPLDFAVEIPAQVARGGIEGHAAHPLPRAVLAHILRDRVAPVEMELAAYEHHSKEKLVNLILMDPWTRSEKQARAYLDEVLSQPGHERMREYYSSQL
jgi:alpha-galactosidase